MNTISKEFLEDIGIQLDDQTYQAFSEHFKDTLFDRIIDSTVDALDDNQMQQLSQMSAADGDQLWQWLQANVPEFGDIVQDEIDILLGELAENSEHI